jgi:ABC-type transporter Mla maintaining outer membrane lipid asymmetry permease subunit MlaE
MINRRLFIAALLVAATSASAFAAEPPLVTVYLNPT